MKIRTLNKLCFTCCCVLLMGCDTLKKTYSVITNPSIRVGDRLDQPSAFSISIYATNRININAYSDNVTASNVTASTDSIFKEDLVAEDFFEEEARLLEVEKDFSDDYEESIDMEELEKKSKDNLSRLAERKRAENEIPENKRSASPQATPVKLRIVQLSEKSLFLSATYDELSDDKFKKTLGKNYLEHDDLMIDPSQFRFFENKPMEEGTKYIGVIAYFNEKSVKKWRDVVKVRSNGEIYPLLVRVSEDKVNLYKDN